MVCTHPSSSLSLFYLPSYYIFIIFPYTTGCTFTYSIAKCFVQWKIWNIDFASAPSEDTLWMCVMYSMSNAASGTRQYDNTNEWNTDSIFNENWHFSFVLFGTKKMIHMSWITDLPCYLVLDILWTPNENHIIIF